MKTIKIGNHLKVKTKYEEVIGKVVYLGKNCIELKTNTNEYKTFLYVSLLKYTKIS